MIYWNIMTQPPTRVPVVTIYEGNDVKFPLYSFLDENEVEIDLSDWTWAAQWRTRPTNDEFLPLIVDSTEAELGTLSVTATGATTESMKTSGYWDLTGEFGNLTMTLVYGRTEYIRNVTRT
jgi:hypothetical protein